MLFNLTELLRKGDFTVEVGKIKGLAAELKDYKQGKFTYGQVVDRAEALMNVAKLEYEKNPKHETNLDKVNEFLLEIRKKYWGL